MNKEKSLWILVGILSLSLFTGLILLLITGGQRTPEVGRITINTTQEDSSENTTTDTTSAEDLTTAPEQTEESTDASTEPTSSKPTTGRDEPTNPTRGETEPTTTTPTGEEPEESTTQESSGMKPADDEESDLEFDAE